MTFDPDPKTRIVAAMRIALNALKSYSDTSNPVWTEEPRGHSARAAMFAMLAALESHPPQESKD